MMNLGMELTHISVAGVLYYFVLKDCQYFPYYLQHATGTEYTNYHSVHHVHHLYFVHAVKGDQTTITLPSGKR